MFIHCFNMDLESAINVYTINKQSRTHNRMSQLTTDCETKYKFFEKSEN